MLAQKASGYDVSGRNFHIKREPVYHIAVLGASKPARPVPEPARLVLLGVLADEPARPVPETVQADSRSSSSSGSCNWRTYAPKRLEIGTWKSNEEKNKGKIMKRQCTFDGLMSKYKQQKVNSMNRPLKKEPTPPKQEDQSKKIMVSQVVPPLQ